MHLNFTEPGRSVGWLRDHVQRHRSTITFLMRVSFVYLATITCSLQMLAANIVSSQSIATIEVTVALAKGEKLDRLFKDIERQSGLLFAFSSNMIKRRHPTIPLAKRTVKEVLDLALAGTGLKYKQVDNSVIVFQEREVEEESASAEPIVAEEAVAQVEEVTDMFVVTGKVTEGATNTPLPGVSVLVMGTSRGTSTDATGAYSIEVREKDVLVFSFIGFKTQEVAVSAQTMIDVSMVIDVKSLEEVTISGGYYKTTDALKTGNIVKITSEEIERQPVTSPLMALQGRVAGLEITPRSGMPGHAPMIQVRGRNSLRTDGGFPLYVIDGIPIDSRPLSTGTYSLMDGGLDPLSGINPANIESIEVLKDGDATAIYGSRGANGVILITTRQSQETRSKTSLDINVYTGVGKVFNKLDLLNTQQYLEMRHESFKNDNGVPQPWNYDLTLWDTTRYTDWQDVLLGGTSNITDIQASISGGNSLTSFRFGGGFHKETMVFPGDFGYRRLSGHFSLIHTSPLKKFSATLSINYGADNNKLFDDSNFVNSALTLPPHAPELYDEDGNLNWEPTPEGFRTWDNPLSVLRKTHNVTSGNWIANTTLSYQIVEHLIIKANLGYTELQSSENFKRPFSAMAPSEISSSTKAHSYFGTNRRKSWIIEPQANYVRTFGNNGIDFLLGATWQDNINAKQLIHASGYTSDVLLDNILGAAATQYLTDDYYKYRYSAMFLRIGYTYKNKYIMNLTGRRDGSSRFGPGKRFGNFGAIGAAWILSEEPFLYKNLPFISFAKLRSSYGTTGNDQIGDYQFYDTYSLAYYKYQDSPSLYPTALYNPNFAWEITKKLEAAVQLGILKDRILLEAVWYRNRSSNQLINNQLPATTGFESVLSNFAATIQNSGWEFLLRSENINNPNVRWSTSINFSASRNKLVAFPGIEESSYAQMYKVGESLSVQRLYTWMGVNPQTGFHDFLDVNEDGLIADEDKKFMNPNDRKYYGGMNNIIRYKGFELSFLLEFSNQNSIKYFTGVEGGNSNEPTGVLNRWQQEGDKTNYQKFSQSFLAFIGSLNARQSNYNIDNASFIRLKTLSLSYFLPQNFLKKVKIREGKVYLQGQNLFTFTEYVNLDPQTGSGLPPLRMLTLGLSINL